MKRNNFNKLVALLGVFIAVSLSSCIKNYRNDETNFSNLKPTANIYEGGLYQFGSQALLFPGTDLVDTATFHINYAAVNVAPADEVFTIGINPSAVTAYNTTGGLQFDMLPDSCFSFTATSATVLKGQNYSNGIPVVFYPGKISPDSNYMLPISLTQAPAGVTISSNISTIYYHFIGCPIAGTYEQYWSRWNASDSTGGASTAAYYLDDLGPVTFAPNSPTEAQVTSQGVGETDIIDFTNTNGVLSNFTVTITSVSGITEGIPVMELADPIHGIYKIYFTYVNSSGATRVIVNTYIKH